jgi:hypothetical protein
MHGVVTLKGKSNAAFLGFKGRARASAFLRFGRVMQYVRPGSRFRRANSGNVTETARVLSVATDTVGIPHIRYEITFERPHWLVTDGPRILSSQSFAATYKETV